jgi:hypothetical protein
VLFFPDLIASLNWNWNRLQRRTDLIIRTYWNNSKDTPIIQEKEKDDAVFTLQQ